MKQPNPKELFAGVVQQAAKRSQSYLEYVGITTFKGVAIYTSVRTYRNEGELRYTCVVTAEVPGVLSETHALQYSPGSDPNSIRRERDTVIGDAIAGAEQRLRERMGDGSSGFSGNM